MSSSSSLLRAGSRSLILTGILSTPVGLLTALYPPALDESQWGHPFDPSTHVAVALVLVVAHLLKAHGFFALAQLPGAGRATQGALWVAAVGFVMVAACEGASALLVGVPITSPAAIQLNDGYGISSMVFALASIVGGALIARKRLLPGFGRWSVLLSGAFMLFVVTPALIAGRGPLAYLALTAWSLFYLWIGLVARRAAAEDAPSPEQPRSSGSGSVKRILLRVGLALVALFVLVTLGAGIFVWAQSSAFDASMAKVHDFPLRDIRAATGEQAIARGKHIAQSVGGCALSECHGSDLAGGETIVMGPLGEFTGPNLTAGGVGARYTDAEIVRAIEHGVKKDGRSLLFMPAFEYNWLPDSDLRALLAYIRSVPAVEKPNGPVEIGLLGKILDRQGSAAFDVARKIDHDDIKKAPPPEPTAKYGAYVAQGCVNCHGESFSGGPLPGAPPDLPVPLNITPHESGIRDWSFEDFSRLLDEGVMKDGSKLSPFMPLSSLKKMDATERTALWKYLRSLPPRAFGGR